MTPSGGPDCTGSRPIVLYAHGTTTVKSYNLANLLDEGSAAYSEAALIAAIYAAQGFIVVAPNYAGYDASKLAYHPYLNADQESKEMMDALSAARKALPGLLQPVQDSGKLFITGYSQGGHVAMATHKAMQAAGQTVTASAPMSGPYALAAFGDAVYLRQRRPGQHTLHALADQQLPEGLRQPLQPAHRHVRAGLRQRHRHPAAHRYPAFHAVRPGRKAAANGAVQPHAAHRTGRFASVPAADAERHQPADDTARAGPAVCPGLWHQQPRYQRRAAEFSARRLCQPRWRGSQT